MDLKTHISNSYLSGWSRCCLLSALQDNFHNRGVSGDFGRFSQESIKNNFGKTYYSRSFRRRNLLNLQPQCSFIFSGALAGTTRQASSASNKKMFSIGENREKKMKINTYGTDDTMQYLMMYWTYFNIETTSMLATQWIWSVGIAICLK